ncbi:MULTISPECIES: hypothetical protein [unclassified Methylobacterium]|uniref:hypothetical protein n=1 Tax=unclassified Methylobacterium TaxID=2615210 RepID=UPI001F4421F8|nr:MULTISPECIES: hypothetical protein [Methylobacterium]WFT83082.1 hypothetical protein QA634_15145 [Methylobacterium nodulans]
MTRSPITGAARGPSNEEFRERIARLAPVPGTEPSSASRASRGKPARGQRPAPPPDAPAPADAADTAES